MPTHPDQTRTESTRKSLFQRNTIFGTRVGGRLAVATSVARVLAGLLFILTSFPKFPFAGQAHRDEMAAFVSFDSPTHRRSSCWSDCSSSAADCCWCSVSGPGSPRSPWPST